MRLRPYSTAPHLYYSLHSLSCLFVLLFTFSLLLCLTSWLRVESGSGWLLLTCVYIYIFFTHFLPLFVKVGWRLLDALRGGGSGDCTHVVKMKEPEKMYYDREYCFPTHDPFSLLLCLCPPPPPIFHHLSRLPPTPLSFHFLYHPLIFISLACFTLETVVLKKNYLL